ncbi:MAG: hypothetical protein HPM95_06275 [Alphaproteobacteria bacterium]|nr:hypothetical protein [Alphaproteobacteria bacterium]
MKLNAMRSNQGWMLTLAIADRAREIFVQLPGEEFKSTGFVNGALDPTTGQKIPYPAFELPGNVGDTAINVSYRDIRDEMQGPLPSTSPRLRPLSLVRRTFWNACRAAGSASATGTARCTSISRI